MEAGCMKRQWLKASQLGRCFLLLLLMLSPSFGDAWYYKEEIASLQALFAAWNKSNPPADLEGWSSTRQRPCEPDAIWRGVTCTEVPNSETNTKGPSRYIIGLTLSEAHINGTLPDVFGWPNLSGIGFLTLTGNPELTGPLPPSINSTWLNTLDLHDNGFNGSIPNINFSYYLEKLDLSGNRITGEYPSHQLQNASSLLSLNIGGNKFFGNIPENATRSMKRLQKLNISYNNFTGKFPNFRNWSNLQYLDISSNHFQGPLPNFSTSSNLEYVYLGGNNFSGTLTNFFDHFNVSKVKIVNVSDNNLSGSLPFNFISSNVSSIQELLQDNPYCNGNDYDDARRCYCKQDCSITPKFDEFDVKPTIYSYNELKAATRDFHIENKLGEGGYGAVYKGVLSNGNVVAIKQLFVKTKQSIDDFSNEIVLITGMKHRNLVNLKGCCLRENSKILVYEYVDNYDVDQILLGPHRQEVPWLLRLKICMGVAHGLHYLHALAHPRVIHRDIKASNILLDKNLEPKIADFGLVLLFPDKETHIMTIHVAGTKGYLAPEYASLGQLSDKVDVFSFGVLCLEIISGRRNIDESLPQDQVFLTQWAWKLHQSNKLIELVDQTLHLSDGELQDVLRIIKIALLCIQNDCERRPTMERVVYLFQGDTQSEVVVLNRSEDYLHKQQWSQENILSPLTTEIELLSHEYSSEFEQPELKDI
nr:probable LRR receptor-like serine/threonine-protein kinase At1g34110 isoform X4 [Physcomitrium patens]|eukprot:XP_024395386.1 probable LRR receptor-like serine/threonine-protein kinase At1g34110 isoform X4 [Physcomitrella patens]